MAKDKTSRKPEQTGLVRIGQLDLLKDMVKDLPPQHPTRAQSKIITASEIIHLDPPDPDELAFLARELVQCTLPHSDPGQVPFWARTNGHMTLSIVSGFDPRATKLVGYPYGSIPRLIMFWVTTEALRRQSRKIELGASYNEFLRDIGFDPNTGGGKRSDARRVKEQTRRLFASTISFIQSGELEPERDGERRLNMSVAAASELWWDPKKPDQVNLWDSWVELGEKFYAALTAAPVPVDLRALRALKRSPLALDLYAWATHKSLSVARKGKPQFIPWKGLKDQFGADYADTQNFRRKAVQALKKIQTVYPGLKLQDATGGIIVLPSSRPAIALKPKFLTDGE
ncbi:plasmid replication protein (plasmid) [Bryobacterales bacterium F-183]|nr:plasmid replication protein [Bryobacterales bacterium F-183]